jgi:hypothetical protein
VKADLGGESISVKMNKSMYQKIRAPKNCDNIRVTHNGNLNEFREYMTGIMTIADTCQRR